ncbi:protein-tyrosine phosphatase [Rhodothalassium salexigens DSM 2132]|uniref:protein-tyrosine-phosphatase n=1 Tax=Rhodothalassium salexigens DSM 2132 TaxID=1188247 RepID=A0A4R2P919_RHOSA|nr:low molecular weight protein-tyrosine-phosphatase [Rhodothalassium salexigens]MBB4212465.1 protein-tyrosine phosphatase [Rhodothalassium salexigens DSM 2132]MBK1639545.1 phosphotyrosine protein phosphatase [Rhodothalassium salexigens DSM 2132]TCP31493.1 protein-tyrosine phosphatase [Rhodothalassium salexigens DSM 2132]
MASVLFVCLGNICRSPMAEGALRRAAAQAGLDGLQIASAGTGDWHVGNPPDPRAQATARRHGVDISGQRAAQVRADDFHRFDHILAMDATNLAALERLRPAGAQADLRLFLDYAGGAGAGEVPDPYYGGDGGFDHVWSLVCAAADGLVAHLQQTARAGA